MSATDHPCLQISDAHENELLEERMQLAESPPLEGAKQKEEKKASAEDTGTLLSQDLFPVKEQQVMIYLF